jgi:hypothetical protein
VSPRVTNRRTASLGETDEDTQVSATPGRDHGDMSTDQHGRTRPPAPDEGPAQQEKPKSSLSITQVVAGALAAMTAAALGSRIGVAGTLLGAAFASIVAAVASALYTASLRRTSKGVSAVLVRVRPTSSTPGAPADRGVPAASADARPDLGPGTRADLGPVTAVEAGAGSDWVLPDPARDGVAVAEAPEARRRIAWKPALVGALLMFLVAALVLTGIELATGRALSGGTGTTVGQVADPATRPSPTPTARTTPTPTATPSPTRSALPSAAPTATPSSAPTAAPSATPSSAPTPTATPSSSTPSAAPTPSGLSSTS